jgi:hypothetical protein
MDILYKRLWLGLTLGMAMCGVVWLNLSESSPFHVYLMQKPDVGYALLILNLPALFLGRILSGTPPPAAVVYLACSAQWFFIGIGLSFAVWRRPGA